MTNPLQAANHFGQRIQEKTPISIVEVEILLRIAVSGDMVERMWVFKSKEAYFV